MACRAPYIDFDGTLQSYWISMLNRMVGKRSLASQTKPKMKPLALESDTWGVNHTKPRLVKGDLVPVYVALGMIVLSLSLGAHMVMQQLKYSPTVRVRKKRRESLPELKDPDHVVEEANMFINKSFLRKVAHIQEFDPDHSIIPNLIRGDLFIRYVC